jgi:hypothetical protein
MDLLGSSGKRASKQVRPRSKRYCHDEQSHLCAKQQCDEWRRQDGRR